MAEEGDEMNLLAILREEKGASIDHDKEEDNADRDDVQHQHQHHQPPLEEEEQRYHLSSSGTTVVIRQLRSQGLSFQLWPAASTLVSLLDNNPSLFLAAAVPGGQHRCPIRILELGAGTGLAGIAAATAVGARVTITDLPHVLPNLRFNAAANAAAVCARGGTVEVRQLRWGHHDDYCSITAETDLEGAESPPFDLVMASDVVYYEELVDPLLETVRYFVRGEGVAFVMAHLRRWKKRDAVFFRKARKLFDVALLHTDPPLPGSRVGVAVYRFVEREGRRNCSNRQSHASKRFLA